MCLRQATFAALRPGCAGHRALPVVSPRPRTPPRSHRVCHDDTQRPVPRGARGELPGIARGPASRAQRVQEIHRLHAGKETYVAGDPPAPYYSDRSWRCQWQKRLRNYRKNKPFFHRKTTLPPSSNPAIRGQTQSMGSSPTAPPLRQLSWASRSGRPCHSKWRPHDGR